jgi:mRNA interferase MazF
VSMIIKQGDIYWIPVRGSNESEAGIPHPHVVIQDDAINHSSSSVTVCALTTNRRQAKAPGNVLLEANEANLSRQSIVVVSQVSTVEKAQLGAYIGSLTRQRIDQILAGMRFLERMMEHHG